MAASEKPGASQIFEGKIKPRSEPNSDVNSLDTDGGGDGGGPLDPSWFVFFSYLLNFCRQWHLCKFLILN